MIRDKIIKNIKDVDWEFEKDNTQYLTHNFHRFSSKFIPQIARNLIENFSEEGESVLDAFVGSGTTLVEANLLNRKSIGVDLNPLSALIAKTKSAPLGEKQLNDINNFVTKLKDRIMDLRRGKIKEKDLKKPDFSYIDKWYQPMVLSELSLIKEEINKVKNKKIKEFLVCGFSAILRNVSNAYSDFGNLAVDKNRKNVKDTFERFEKQILMMIDKMKEYSQIVKKNFANVYMADARKINFIDDNSIDLIVTHPPYISAVPYAEYQKLSLNWLGSSFCDLFPREYSENLNPRNLDKNILGGGRGKDDVVERFSIGMAEVFSELLRVLKPKKYCCIVIGHPTVKGKIINLKNSFLEVAKKIGFAHFYTITRGSHRTTMGKMKEEYILIFQKS